jgi:hypothetical protein
VQLFSGIARILKLLTVLVAGILYVWFTAVRAVPFVRRRRTARHERRAAQYHR